MARTYLGSTGIAVLVAWLAALGGGVVPLNATYTYQTVLAGVLFLLLGIIVWFWFSVRPSIQRY